MCLPCASASRESIWDLGHVEIHWTTGGDFCGAPHDTKSSPLQNRKSCSPAARSHGNSLAVPSGHAGKSPEGRHWGEMTSTELLCTWPVQGYKGSGSNHPPFTSGGQCRELLVPEYGLLGSGSTCVPRPEGPGCLKAGVCAVQTRNPGSVGSVSRSGLSMVRCDHICRHKLLMKKKDYNFKGRT